MAEVRWTLRLAESAERDIADILAWTTERFGRQQARRYAETLLRAVQSLEGGLDAAGARSREDLAPDIRLLHVARKGRNGRHLVIYRVSGERTTDVLRVLHDSMDLPRHVDG